MISPYASDYEELLGWHDAMPNEIYHQNPGLSKSSLDLVHKSINHLLSREIVRKETPAMALGTAAHSAVLEPETWPAEFCRGPEVDRRNKKWKEAAKEAKDNGQMILPPGDFDKVDHIAAAVHGVDDPVIKAIKEGKGIAEGSLFVTDPVSGALIKCRPDYMLPLDRICFDLKTTKDASASEFARSCGSFRYDVQAALYSDCLSWEFDGDWQFIFGAVESSPPFNTAIYTLSDRDIEIGREIYMEDIARYMSWSDGYEPEVGYQAGRAILTVPKYFRRKN